MTEKEKTGLIFTSKTDFITYLMLYAANCDGNISEKEQKLICSKADTTIFEKMYEQFKSDSDYNCLQNIIAYKSEHLQSEADLVDIIDSIKKIFFVDKVFSTYEQSIVSIITRILK